MFITFSAEECATLLAALSGKSNTACKEICTRISTCFGGAEFSVDELEVLKEAMSSAYQDFLRQQYSEAAFANPKLRKEQLLTFFAIADKIMPFCAEKSAANANIEKPIDKSQEK